MLFAFSQLINFLKTYNIVSFEDCFEHHEHESVSVFIAGPKGGIAFVGKTLSILMQTCGVSFGTNIAADTDWAEMGTIIPDAEFKLFLAYGESSWEEYLEKEFNELKSKQCVVFIRSPAARFVSLYGYVKDGSEKVLQKYSNEMKGLDSTAERIDYLWEALAKRSFQATHPTLRRAVEKNCTQISVDKLFKGGKHFDREVIKMFNAIGIKREQEKYLLEKVQVNDLTRASTATLTKNKHKSGRSLELYEKEEVRALISKHEIIAPFLKRQCQELNLKLC